MYEQANKLKSVLVGCTIFSFDSLIQAYEGCLQVLPAPASEVIVQFQYSQTFWPLSHLQ